MRCFMPLGRGDGWPILFHIWLINFLLVSRDGGAKPHNSIRHHSVNARFPKAARGGKNSACPQKRWHETTLSKAELGNRTVFQQEEKKRLIPRETAHGNTTNEKNCILNNTDPDSGNNLEQYSAGERPNDFTWSFSSKVGNTFSVDQDLVRTIDLQQ